MFFNIEEHMCILHAIDLQPSDWILATEYIDGREVIVPYLVHDVEVDKQDDRWVDISITNLFGGNPRVITEIDYKMFVAFRYTDRSVYGGGNYQGVPVNNGKRRNGSRTTQSIPVAKTGGISSIFGG